MKGVSMPEWISLVDLCAAMGVSDSFAVKGLGCHKRFSFPAALTSATPEQFSFCYGENAAERILASNAGMVICSKEFKERGFSSDVIVRTEEYKEKVLIFVDDPRLTFVRILQKLFSDIPPKITIGKDVLIHESVILGTEGYGFVIEENGIRVRFPCVGGIHIGDDVTIDAGSIVDRGTLGDTVIGNNTKIGKLVMIGHNSQIGKDCVIATHANISGGTTLGDGVWIAPGVVTNGYIRIGERAFIGTGAVVIKGIGPGRVAYGVPAREMRDRVKEVE